MSFFVASIKPSNSIGKVLAGGQLCMCAYNSYFARPPAFRQSPLELRTFWFSFSGNGQFLFEFELLLGYLSEVLKVTHYDQHGLQV